MNNFLHTSKSALENIESYEKVYAVLGNESCDLDSAISALVYGYFLHTVHNSPTFKAPVVPLLNIKEDEFPLRTETKYFLQKMNINTQYLIFRNEINLTALAKENKLKLILVDHHVLPKQDQDLEKSVIEVIDHRPVDKNSNWKDINVTMNAVGSCSTLVTNIILNSNSNILDETIAKLLHGTIVLDTINFNQDANRFKQLDLDIANKLEDTFKIQQTREEIFNELSTARSDVSNLTSFQILHRDLKIVNGLPIPGLPMLLLDFLELKDAVKSLTEFCHSKKCKVIVVMGLIRKNNVVYRDLGVFSIQDSNLKTALVNKLRMAEDLCLTEVRKNVTGLVLFSQGNIQISRKQIVPLLRPIITEQ